MASYVAENVSIHPRAEIDADVEIGPFCVIGPNVRIGRGTRLENNVTLMGRVTLGEHNHIFPGVVVGGEPQDLSYRGSDTQVIIGDHNIIRECVTINRGTEKEEGVTTVGSHNFLMACCHIAHDCRLGNHIVIANGTLLGGHVHVHDHASLSGAVAVHHYASIGSYSFISGCSRVLHDVPPFMLVEGHPARARCINVVALKRNEFSPDVVNSLAEAHRLLYRAKVGLDHAREILRGNDQLAPQVNELLSFIQMQQEGKHGRAREAQESGVTKLKMAVIGAGHLGRIHARLLSQMNDVELVGIVDPVPAARDSAAAECHAPAYADHSELVGQIDAAVIATPTRHHHAVALDLLRHDKPLLVEKPICDNLAHADELVETARLRGVVLQVGHIERFNPAFLAAQARVGQPRYIEAVRASGYTGRSVDIGVVFDLMIHDIDLLLALVAAPITRVAAMGVAVLGRHEDVAQARVEFADGAVANLSASRLSFNPAPKRQMQIWSEQGFAAIDFGNRSAALVSPSESILRREMDFETLDMAGRTRVKDRLFSDVLKVESLEIAATNALADELRDFVDAVRLHREPRVTGQQGRDALALADAILESIAEHSWHGAAAGPIGPLARPAQHALRGPHWHAAAQTRPAA